MDNLLKSNVLKEIGLSEKNQWILFDDQAKTFFNHLAENLDSDNILTQQELMQFEEIKAAGKFLEADVLTEELKNLESYFPGILSITNESIEDMQQELNFLQADTKEREDRIQLMEDTKKQQQKKIGDLERRNMELDYQVELLSKESLEKAQNLEELQKTNQKNVQELKQIYIQQVSLDQCYLLHVITLKYF